MIPSVFSGKLVHLVAVDPEKDAEALVGWNRDSEYSRLLSDNPAYQWAPKEVKEWMENQKGDQLYSIRTLAENRLIGTIGLSGFDWVARHAWVGIGLGEREFWGQGYGTDAMRVLLRYAFQELNLNRINLNVFEYNERALKSYLKCGFGLEGRIRQAMLREGRRWDIIYMGILKSEWEAANP
jgi:RimJ/RimL family protein N-acetyltransferase